MTDDPTRCGSTDTDSGEPCQRPAGWGTESEIGPCRDHPAVGRPSKFNEERRDAILEAARRGTTVEGCARAAGIHHSTLYDWLDEFSDFSEAFNRARAEGEQRLVEEVAIEDPKFILERSFDYVKTERREVDMDASHSFDASEGVTAEFVTYEEATDVDE